MFRYSDKITLQHMLHGCRQLCNLAVTDNIRYHYVNQPSERSDPHPVIHKGLLQYRHINRISGFHHPDGTKHPYIRHTVITGKRQQFIL